MPARRCVLVVEDDPGIRNMLGLAIESLGHEPRLSDGREPLDTHGLDAVILDVRLGARSALDVLEEHPELHAVPLIVATASDRGPAAAVGRDALVLPKPFDLPSLERVLAEALDGGARQR